VTAASSLVQVHGAELVDGRLVFAGADQQASGVGLFGRAWRFVGPRPVEVFPGERFMYATRLHWWIPLKDMAASGVMWPLAMMVSWLLDLWADGFWVLKLGVWLGAVAHQLMMCHQVLLWRAHLVVVTSQRLLEVRGVFTSTVDSRKLWKITDVEVHQSFWGKLFGFGVLRIESGGRHDDGAKRELITFVPDPGAVHRATHMAMFEAQR